jgi:hypothetical protein
MFAQQDGRNIFVVRPFVDGITLLEWMETKVEHSGGRLAPPMAAKVAHLIIPF